MCKVEYESLIDACEGCIEKKSSALRLWMGGRLCALSVALEMRVTQGLNPHNVDSQCSMIALGTLTRR